MPGEFSKMKFVTDKMGVFLIFPKELVYIFNTEAMSREMNDQGLSESQNHLLL